MPLPVRRPLYLAAALMTAAVTLAPIRAPSSTGPRTPSAPAPSMTSGTGAGTTGDLVQWCDGPAGILCDAADPAACPAGKFVTDVDASGVLTCNFVTTLPTVSGSGTTNAITKWTNGAGSVI